MLGFGLFSAGRSWFDLMVNHVKFRRMGDTKTRILEAADHVLCEAGYRSATVRAVALRAGVNKGLVFYHFESKAGLLDAVLERYYREHLKALTGAFAASGTLKERLLSVLDAYFGFMCTHHRYSRLVSALVADDPARIAEVRRHLEPLYTWFDAALSELAPDAGSASRRQLFLTFSGLVTGYFLQAELHTALFGIDSLAKEETEARREHLHWLADVTLSKLEQST